MKLKWTVSPPPTGQFRSFESRAWPSADYADGKTAAVILCEDEYRPADVRSCSHRPLKVQVADWSVRRKDPSSAAFVWRTLVKRFKSLDEAKAGAAECLAAHPEFLPVEGDQS